ncbi:MAG: glycogen/starch synthase, partial [Armatimonadota bacterium]|nr:glycogen/starch synthase [Armatimonadota bacterium]
MRVLFCSSEIAPLAKTGGLADVAGALPKALARRGVEVRLAMPAYRGVRLPEAHPAGRVSVSLGGERVEGTIVEGRMPDSGLPVWLVEQPGFFDRAGLYGEGGADYPDNLARFTFFCRAVQQWVDRGGWVPEVVHCNDWQTALLPVLLKTEGPGGVATVLTIHNLAYQGVFPADQFRLTGLPASVFTIRGLEFWGKV